MKILFFYLVTLASNVCILRINAISFPPFIASLLDVLSSNEPTYKLSYFASKGRAESIRMVLAECGVKYEDIRIPIDSWPSIKNDYIFTQLPTFEIKHRGKLTTIAQSHAILNLLAKKCDLLPDDDIEAAYADMFALQFTDVFNAFGQILFDTPNNQSARFNEFFNGIWSLTMNRTEERIRSNSKHNCKVIAGKDLSYADIYLSSILELASAKGTNRTREQFLDAYPYIKQVDIKVRSRPGIARWLMTRPITEN